MEKSRIFSFLVLFLLWLAASVAAFLLPIDRNYAFKITYAFVCAAFIIQFIIANTVIGNKSALRYKFLGIPLIYAGLIYLSLQLAVFAFMVLIKDISINIVWLINSLIFIFSLLAIISSYYGRDVIDDIDIEIKDKTAFLRNSILRLEILLSKSGGVSKKQISALLENIKYSDSVSVGALQDIESKIALQFASLENAVREGNADISQNISEIERSFGERNALCKTFKQ